MLNFGTRKILHIQLNLVRKCHTIDQIQNQNDCFETFKTILPSCRHTNNR